MTTKTLGMTLLVALLASVSLAAPAAKPTLATAPETATLVGVFSMPPEKARDWPFTVTRAGARDLPALQSAGVKAIVALAGGKPQFSDPRGCFSGELWKQSIDKHDVEEIQRYVDSGTIVGLYAVDEPHDWKCGPSYADIDAICAYANSKWPKMPCGVNAPPSWMERGRQQMPHVGFLFVQYSARKGTVKDWTARQVSESSWFKGDVWLSVQLLQPRISVAEFKSAGLEICSAHPRGVMFWKWSDEWFAQPGAREAAQAIANACASQAATK